MFPPNSAVAILHLPHIKLLKDKNNTINKNVANSLALFQIRQNRTSVINDVRGWIQLASTLTILEHQ
jgi:hypothetical protein